MVEYTGLRVDGCRLRRRRCQAAVTASCAAGVENPGSHAWAAARSHRAEVAVLGPGRDHRARRSRSHAGHGLHPRHQAHHGVAAGHREAPEPAFFGDVLQRDQEARRPAAQRADPDRSRGAKHGGGDGRARTVYKVGAAAIARSCEHIGHLGQSVAGALLRPALGHGALRARARQLEKDGLKTTAIHGDKSQAARLEALDDFKAAKVQVMWSPPMSRRAGLDIDALPLVVNYELPYVPEDYIHRIGRTGRAGASGRSRLSVAVHPMRKSCSRRSSGAEAPDSSRDGRWHRVARRFAGVAKPRARSTGNARRQASASLRVIVFGAFPTRAAARDATASQPSAPAPRVAGRVADADDRNSDQAPIVRETDGNRAASALGTAGRPSAHRKHPIPALLMKRTTRRESRKRSDG